MKNIQLLKIIIVVGFSTEGYGKNSFSTVFPPEGCGNDSNYYLSETVSQNKRPNLSVPKTLGFETSLYFGHSINNPCKFPPALNGTSRYYYLYHSFIP